MANNQTKMGRDETDHPKVLNSLWECGTSLHNISIINNTHLQNTKSHCFFLFPVIIWANG